MITTEAIQQQVASYLAKGIDIETLEDWIAQQTWNIQRSGDLRAIHLAYAVDLRLSEHSSGHMQEPQLRQELSALLLTPFFVCGQSVVGDSGSSNQPVQGQEWQLLPPAGIAGATVHA